MATEELVIKPNQSSVSFSELNEYKQLIYFFTWRELKVRYKQTLLGMTWVALEPLVMVIIVGMINLKRNPDYGVPDAPAWLLLFLSFVAWGFVQSCFSGSVNSFVSNQGLFRKIYFPKVIPAIANVLSRFTDLIFGLLVFCVLATFWSNGFAPILGILTVVVLAILAAAGAFGLGLALGMANVQFRDVKLVLPAFTRAAFFATPVFWPVSDAPEWMQGIMYFNPAAALVQSTREAMFDPSLVRWDLMWQPLITVTILMTVGIFVFKRRENKIVDIV